MGTNCPWNGAFLTSSWPSWWGWTLHPSLLCPHCDDDFCLLQCLILNFLARDMLSQRLKKIIKMEKTFFPLEPSPQKKSIFCPLWPKLWGLKNSENSLLLGTKIFQFGQRGDEKIRFKDFTLASKYPSKKNRALCLMAHWGHQEWTGDKRFKRYVSFEKFKKFPFQW